MPSPFVVSNAASRGGCHRGARRHAEFKQLRHEERRRISLVCVCLALLNRAADATSAASDATESTTRPKSLPPPIASPSCRIGSVASFWSTDSVDECRCHCRLWSRMATCPANALHRYRFGARFREGEMPAHRSAIVKGNHGGLIRCKPVLVPFPTRDPQVTATNAPAGQTAEAEATRAVPAGHRRRWRREVRS